MERGAWTKLGVGDRVVASAVCVLTGAALIWVVWCFVELEGPVALSAVLFAGSVLPRALQLVYVATFGGAAIAVGRYRVSSFVLLLPLVAALIHVCAVVLAPRPSGHIESRVLLSHGIALDVGRASIIAGLFCAGLVWWSTARGAGGAGGRVGRGRMIVRRVSSPPNPDKTRAFRAREARTNDNRALSVRG